MSREIHVRFCEGAGGQFPRATRLIVGFQYEQDAKAFQAALQVRLHEFHLELHPDKTRLIEFGRFAIERRQKRGEGKPATFNFLGFTHICEVTMEEKKTSFWVKRIPKKEKIRATLKKLKSALRRVMHGSIPSVGAWLRNVLEGYFAYYAVPGALWQLSRLRRQLGYFWLKTLRRRDQLRTLKWEQMTTIVDTWLPEPHAMHPLPAVRFSVRNPR